MIPKAAVWHGACPKALARFEPNTFHSLVTDPPAGPVLTLAQGESGVGNYHSYNGDLGTEVPRIGAHKGNVAEHRRARKLFWTTIRPIWREVYRVLRPGAFGVVWAHPVTSHWTAMSLEDEGFEVRNTLHVDYGSGALRGSSRDHLPEGMKDWNSKVATSTEHWILVRKPPDGTLHDNFLKWEAGLLNVLGCGQRGNVATNTIRFKRSSGRDGNPHPTPKNIDLMRWLVRLVTPPGGLVLDPMAGSGSTGEAALLEGFSSVLIEPVKEFADYAEQRCGSTLPATKPHHPTDDLFDLFSLPEPS